MNERWLLLVSAVKLLSFFFLSLSRRFLEKNHVKGINRDVWREYLNFTRTIGADMDKYDPNAAWPSLLDEFVEASTADKK